MTFLENYGRYNEANEVPDIFTLWGGLFLLSTSLQRRVYATQSRSTNSYDTIIPSLYLGLIGSPGSGKSFAKAQAKRMFSEVFPNYPLGASSQSLETIVTDLSKDGTLVSYQNEANETIRTHSLTFFINEFNNWLRINPTAMIDFLTDIYGERFYDAKTVKRGLEPIELPVINILACGVKDWFQDNFKTKILSGGFARRFICVYHPHERKHKPDQTIHAEHITAWNACVAHLQKLSTLTGRFQWSDDAWNHYAEWYRDPNNFRSPNELLLQFYSSKNIQVIKLAMLYAANEEEPKLTLEKHHFINAIATLDSIEPQMLELFCGVGRNEYAIYMQKMLKHVATAGGRITDKKLLNAMTTDITLPEYLSLKGQLRHTDQLIEQNVIIPPDTIARQWLFLPETYAKYKTI